MTALLTDNLPLLAGAPNGIKKLRELILELGVRGKLVQQYPNDEPASELLKRIAEEKTRLVADGKIKTLKLIEELPNTDGLSNLPSSWRWVRFGEIAQHNSGKTLDKGRNTGISRDYITTSNLYWGRFELDNVKKMLIREDELDKCTATKNDLLICEGGEAGRAAVWEQDKEICFQNHIHRARLYGKLSPHYAQRFFEQINASGEINQYRKGIGISNMSSKALASIKFPLPPLAEQHRIVAKIDELMAHCDRLEAQQADTKIAHAQLVQALVDSLTQAVDAADFAAEWQRLDRHFHTLFTTESSIDALKQTLLQLAVMGKLVPQDPNDEPADELLGKITKEIALLHSEGKIRKPKLTNPISSEDRVFPTPQGWKWVRLSQITRQLGDGLHGTPIYSQDGEYYFVNGNNLKQGKIVIKPETKTVSETEYFKHKKSLDEQSILVSINGTIGNVAFYEYEKIVLGKSACYFNLASGVSKHFVRLLIEAPGFMKYALKNATGTTIKNLGLKAMNDYPIALPPLAEQHNIVRKVDQLMTLCDQLKTRLTQARQLSEQLASTLVERALGEDSRKAPSTTDRQVARTLLAAEITHRLHSQRTFGQRKLQKVIYLAEHVARLAAIQGDYLRDAAGPHDRHLMNQIEGELQNRKWYERIERETVGHAYRPLSQVGQHQQAYKNAWMAAERASIEQVIELMREWNTDRCEMTVTLYAAWNDFILEGRPVTDEAIVAEVMHSWNDTKLRFSKTEWLEVLAEMKEQKILIPTGFGKRTTGGMRNLLGIEYTDGPLSN